MDNPPDGVKDKHPSPIPIMHTDQCELLPGHRNYIMSIDDASVWSIIYQYVMCQYTLFLFLPPNFQEGMGPKLDTSSNGLKSQKTSGHT